MRLNVTPAEREYIILALRSWQSDLEEPLAKPRSVLARRRRGLARTLDDLALRICMADVLPMPEAPE